MSAPLFDELFVANLAPNTTESDIKELFEPYAVVKECWVGHKKQLKGAANTSFSSVRVETHAEAAAAKKALNGFIYKDRNLVVKWASNQRLLWVGSLPDTVTNEALQAGFSQFGTVERAIVVADAHNPVSRRYGFVLFDDKNDAKKALTKCQEGIFAFANSTEPVRVDWARIEDAYEGFSDSISNKKKLTDLNPAVVARIVAPGSQEHAMALRIKQMQLQYEQSKAQLKAQMAAALGQPGMAPTPGPMMNAATSMASQPMNAGMSAGGPQFTGQYMGQTPHPMMGMGMANAPMAPHHMQAAQPNPMGMGAAPNPMGMGVAPNPMAPNVGAMPTIGLGAVPVPSGPQPMVNQNSMMAKGMGESFNSMPPPSKAQMKSGSDLPTLPGAKPPGSHDHRGIGFSGAAGPSQTSQQQSSYNYAGSSNTPGPRPPPLPATPYTSTSQQAYSSTPAQPNAPSYPPPTSIGQSFGNNGFNMGMQSYSAPQGMSAGGMMQQPAMQQGMQGGQFNYAPPPAQSGYGQPQMGQMGQFGAVQGAGTMLGMGTNMQQQQQQPMSGYATPGMFGATNYAPPPLQQQQMY